MIKMWNLIKILSIRVIALPPQVCEEAVEAEGRNPEEVKVTVKVETKKLFPLYMKMTSK